MRVFYNSLAFAKKLRYNNAVINNTIIAKHEVKMWQIEITP